MKDESTMDETCPQCGETVTDPSHSCSEPSTAGTDETPRISIPPGLWDTGLFKPARMPRTEHPAVSGSLLSRPGDLVKVQPEPEASEPEPEPMVAAEAAPDEVDGTTRESSTGGIDDSLVVPAFLIAAAEGRTSADLPPTVASPAARPDEPTPEESEEPVDPEQAHAALLAMLYPEPSDAPQDPGPGSPTAMVPAGTVPPAPLTDLPDAAPVRETPPHGTRTPPTSAPEPYGEEPEEEEKPRRNRTAYWTAALVLLTAALIGGWFWWQHQQDDPVRETFRTSHSSFMEAAGDLSQAITLEEVADAGTAFKAVDTELEETAEVAGESSSDVAVAARRATLAESEVAKAASLLSELSADDFAPWLEARDSLTSALEGLEGVAADVETAGGDATDLPGTGLADQIAGLIGSQASDIATEKTDKMFADLGAAERVADVRAVGADAAGSAAALQTATEGINAARDAEALVKHTELHTQLGKLADLRPKNLGQWARIRNRLIDRVDFLAGSGAEAKQSIRTADEMISEAITTLAAWDREVEEVRSAKAADREQLTAVETTLERVSTDYASLDSTLGALIGRGNSLESNGVDGDAHQRLAGAADARDRLRSSITMLEAPDSVSEELAAVVTALETHARSVRDAADAAADCAGECVLTETGGWQQMVEARTRQRTAFDSAVAAWEPAAEAALEEINARKAPKRPKV